MACSESLRYEKTPLPVFLMSCKNENNDGSNENRLV